MLKVCSGKYKMGYTQIIAWFSEFASGVIPAEDAECSGHLPMSKTDGLSEVICP
jgi:hypothetical protein